jgi:hypothetical protein
MTSRTTLSRSERLALACAAVRGIWLAPLVQPSPGY